jgi:hypothetical protein
MKDSGRFPILIPLASLAFAAAHLTFEHFTGGVRSHHLLNHTNLPAISNWFELITLPFLGVVLAKKVHAHPTSKRWAIIPVPMLIALLSAFIYGAILIASFLIGAEHITSIAFLGLFVCGVVFPVYRVEYILGFVAGMTFIIGGVLPFLFAIIFAAGSFVLRYIISKAVGIFH